MTDEKMQIALLQGYSHRELSQMYLKRVKQIAELKGKIECLKLEKEILQEDLARTQELLDAAIEAQETLQEKLKEGGNK